MHRWPFLSNTEPRSDCQWERKAFDRQGLKAEEPIDDEAGQDTLDLRDPTPRCIGGEGSDQMSACSSKCSGEDDVHDPSRKGPGGPWDPVCACFARVRTGSSSPRIEGGGVLECACSGTQGFMREAPR